MTPVSIERLLEHRAWVRALARRLVADESRVDDLEQETWLRALRRPPQAARLRGWLGRVVRRLAIDDHRRAQARARREATRSGAEPPSPARLLEQAELQRALADAVVRLEEPYRAVVLLRYFEELPPREIARRLALPVETVRTRLKRGIATMRGRLDSDRTDWRPGVFALAALPGVAAQAAAGGVIVGSTGKNVAAAVALVLLLLGGALWFYTRDGGASAPTRAAQRTPDDVGATNPAPVEGAGTATGAAVPAAEWVARGRVFADPWKDEPMAGARVRAEMFRGYAAEGAALSSAALTTDGEGRAEWTPPAPDFTVTLRFTCAADGLRAASESVLVVRGDTPEPFELYAYALDRTLAGRVADEAGVPVVGARVWTGDKEASVATDRHGRFRLRTGRAEARVHVLADGFATHRTVAKLGPPQSETEIAVTLRHELRITGTVYDEQGSPVEGALVATFFTSRFRSAETDADGRYSLGHLDPGRASHSIYVRKENYCEASAQVRSEEASAERDFRLVRGTRVEGRVVGPDGKPVAGARLDIGFSPFAYNLLRAVSRDDGSFVFAAVPEGSQILRAYKRGLAPERRELDLAGPSHETIVRLSRARRIAGVVRLDGRPLAGVHVAARVRREPMPRRGISDADGRFAVEDLPAGTVDLAVFARGYLRQKHDGVAVDREDLVFDLQRAATLAGRVVDGATGVPVPAFTIRFSSATCEGKFVSYAATWSREGHRFAGTDGYWNCDGEEFPPGTVVVVEASAEGYAPTRYVSVTAAVEPDRDGSIIRLHPGVVLSGLLSDPAGAPVAGASVRLTPGGLAHVAETHDLVVSRTDSAGRFRFENVAPGEYSLHAARDGFAPAFQGGIHVGGDEPPPEQRLAFAPPARIHGVAEPGVEVSLSGVGLRLSRTTTADAQGRYAFENLAGGSYHVSWMFPAGGSYRVVGFGRNVELAAAATVEARLVPGGSGRIEGRVEGKSVPAGGVATLWPLDPGPPTRGTRVVGGRFVLEGVDPGRYRLAFVTYPSRRTTDTELTLADGERRVVTLSWK